MGLNQLDREPSQMTTLVHPHTPIGVGWARVRMGRKQPACRKFSMRDRNSSWT